MENLAKTETKIQQTKQNDQQRAPRHRERSRSRDRLTKSNSIEKQYHRHKSHKKDKKSKHKKKKNHRRRSYSRSSSSSYERLQKGYDKQEQRDFEKRLDDLRQKSKQEKSQKEVQEIKQSNNIYVLNKGLLGRMIKDNVRINEQMDETDVIKATEKLKQINPFTDARAKLMSEHINSMKNYQKQSQGNHKDQEQQE
ncbi:UNKNOWN [Stylonychia lemnae]|uniref:Uncharacterized protein n=1 Tax=Stylonychia lemnae TaxID=5949 RepID=A0A078AFJ6_STYLE|nr:UNKNOWN [Stylonychia lemnae]|eukprot:CDW80287.1 UNKNOWN [Stylonychia lemnae]